MRSTDSLGIEAGRQFIINQAKKVGNYYKDCGCTTHGATFISTDKYGLDFKALGGIENAWAFNRQHWLNYLLYCKTLSETMELPLTIWQAPVGHLNISNSINPRTGNKYMPLLNSGTSWEDSTTTFFFGDNFTPKQTEYNHWAAGPDVIKNIDGSLSWPSMISELPKWNINCYMAGPGVGISTGTGTNAPALGKPDDDFFLIDKIVSFSNL
jgi:hypothetical protein